MMCLIIFEIFDGCWIVVLNEYFIIICVVNYLDQGLVNCYEVNFSVSYDIDINKVFVIIEVVVVKYFEVLIELEVFDCELCGFGDSGIDFLVEFWVNGIDDGIKKYILDVLFLIWNVFRDEGIEIFYLYCVVEFKNSLF